MCHSSDWPWGPQTGEGVRMAENGYGSLWQQNLWAWQRVPRGDEALLGGEHRNSGELSLPGSLAEREMPFWLRGHLCGRRRVKGAWSSGLMDLARNRGWNWGHVLAPRMWALPSWCWPGIPTHRARSLARACMLPINTALIPRPLNAREWGRACLQAWSRCQQHCISRPGYRCGFSPPPPGPLNQKLRGKQSARKAGDPGSISGSERSPWEADCNPLQYACLKSSMDRGAWWATVNGVAQSWTWLSDQHFHFQGWAKHSLWLGGVPWGADRRASLWMPIRLRVLARRNSVLLTSFIEVYFT